MTHINMTSLHTYTCLVCLVSLALQACASTPPPAVLDDATRLIASPETEEYDTLQPKLLREAREYEQKARQAYERGQLDDAKLYAHISIQRYETARNLSERDASKELATQMRAADKALSVEEQRVLEESAELRRFRELEQRYSSIQDELDGVRAELQGSAQRARRELSRARARQAEAIGVGAPTYARQDYARARMLIESAMESMDGQLFDEAAQSAVQATSLFDQTILTAQESEVARRREEKALIEQAAAARDEPPREEALSSQPDMVVNDPGPSQMGRQEALRAIDEATNAQAAALGARMNDHSSDLYNQATFLLDTAERRLAASDFFEACLKAERAQDLFLRGAQHTPDGSLDQARQTIQAAEDARAGAIRRGIEQGPRLEPGDYALDLARRALESKDVPRAIKKATEASLTYDALQATPPPTTADATLDSPLTLAGGGTTSNRSNRSGDFAQAAEQQIVKLQVERAEALGVLKNTSCPGPYQEFEAFLELAQQRFEAEDYAQAFEFSVKASERLRRCDTVAVESTTTSSRRVSTTASKEESRSDELARKKEAERQRDLAIKALSQAQTKWASVSAALPGDARLREASTLLANAEKWYEKREFEQTTDSAKLAKVKLDVLQAEIDTKAISDTPPKEVERTSKTEAPVVACADLRVNLEQTEAAKLRASTHATDDVSKASYERAVNMTLQGQTLGETGVCDASRLMFESARAEFDQVVSMRDISPRAEVTLTPSVDDRARKTDPPVTSSPSVNEEDVMTAEEVEAMMSAERDSKRKEALALEAISKAKLLQARAMTKSATSVYKTAVNLLEDAERAMRKSHFTRAAIMAEQASGAFVSLSESASKEEAASQAEWKPAYSKVLDALIARDRVKPLVTKSEQDTFDRGVNNLTRSRSSWDQKDYFAAGRFADAAKKDFEEAEQAALARREKEEQDEAQRAKELEAKAALDAQTKRQKEQAEREAQRQRERELEAEQERQKKEANQMEREAQRRAAENSLLQAKIKIDLCAKEACTKRDEAAVLRAQATYESAQQAMKNEDYSRTSNLSSQVITELDAALAKALPFEVPAEFTRVKLVGQQLRLEPKIQFVSGGAVMTADSQKTLDELAQVILANNALLSQITLTGFTDSRGKLETNIALSEKRAKAVRLALIQRGVNKDLLIAQGLGPDRPVADNKTKVGREANRRVEVDLTFK